MITPILGMVSLVIVIMITLSERDTSTISFIDGRAFVVVFFGVIGSLMIAMDRRSLIRMILSIRELFPKSSRFTKDMRLSQESLEVIRNAWREDRRNEILRLADEGATEEIRVAADTLIKRQKGEVLKEKFEIVRAGYLHRIFPVIEGWELVAKLGPSFGMVGTVTGMVQLFRHMDQYSSDMGGAIAMALVTTLYGLLLGAAVGGPMASRVNKQFNDRLAFLELLEKTVASLVAEAEQKRGVS